MLGKRIFGLSTLSIYYVEVQRSGLRTLTLEGRRRGRWSFGESIEVTADRSGLFEGGVEEGVL